MNLTLSLTSAILLILIFPRFNLVWLAPIALTPMLFALARETRARRRFLLGWAAGMVYWFGVCYWIQFVLSVHGGVGDAVGWLLLLLFAIAKGLHMGIFALLGGVLMRRWWAVPAVAALWVAIEVTHGPLGFTWLALGNAGTDMSIPMRLAPFTGVYGVSFVFTMMACGLASAILRRPRRELLWLLSLLLLGLLPPLPPSEPGHDAAVLLQPNISETERWTEQSLQDTERRLAGLTIQSALSHPEEPPSIVAWPEVPAPFYYFEDPRFRTYANTLAHTVHAYFLTGIVAHTPEGAPLNSAVLVSPEGTAVSRYDKVNLVPFGEFVPWPLGVLASKISTEAGDFAAGKRVVVSPAGSHSIGTFICYESAFPNFVRQFAAGGAEVLFNISNDGWFGKSAARWQHLNLVRMRAAENRRWILRSTNDGVTGTIDPSGRVRGTLPSNTAAASYTGFTYLSQKTLYSRWGDWFPLACAMASILGIVAAQLYETGGTARES